MPRFSDASTQDDAPPTTASAIEARAAAPTLIARTKASSGRRGRAASPVTVTLPTAKAAEVHAAILAWYRRVGRDLPWRRTRDPYAILVAEAMLQQTQVDRVRPKWEAFLEAFPTLTALAAAPRAEVIRAWAGLGYNRRAVALHEIARTVVDAGGDTLPASVDALRALPGIGPYTAGAIACFAFGLPEPVLDTNVRRVLDRIYAIDPDEGVPADRHGWAMARAALPPNGDVYDWNQALMDLGATVCVARAPRCGVCPVREWCAAVATAEADGAAQPTPLPGLEPFARVAEAPATYRPTSPRRPTERFEGSRRWYRGRAVAALRALAPGVTMEIDALGAHLDADYDASTRRDWVVGLVSDLVRDGLVVSEGSSVRLA
jgi:A/G-specific adenine glycosylase